MRAAITLSLAGPCALVLYAVSAYRYTAYCRIGPRNPFAARAAKPGHIPQWLIKTGPLPANSSSVRVLLELARARNHGRVQIRYFTDEQSRAHVGAHCGERALAAYDMLVPGSYKADLFSQSVSPSVITTRLPTEHMVHMYTGGPLPVLHPVERRRRVRRPGAPLPRAAA
jgi:hypothetical protein